MERRVRAAVGAIVWSMMTALAAAQPGIPKGTQLNPGRVTAGAGNFITIGCVSREGQSTPPVFAITDSRSKPPAEYRLEGDRDRRTDHACVGHAHWRRRERTNPQDAVADVHLDDLREAPITAAARQNASWQLT